MLICDHATMNALINQIELSILARSLSGSSNWLICNPREQETKETRPQSQLNICFVNQPKRKGLAQKLILFLKFFVSMKKRCESLPWKVLCTEF